MASVAHDDRPITTKSMLPMPSLLALFTAGFLGILNETVPAGLLPKMSASLGRSESVAGQTITVYALATALTAIPLNAVLKNLGRRTLLVSALGVFAAANLVIALENSFTVILIARMAAGVAAGLIWSNIGGIAGRLVPENARGKAIAVALAGTPAALSLGLPAGTVLGDATSWHATFGGSATLFVTAGIRAAGTDEVQAAVVTVFNLSIAAGGVFGGLLLAGFGVTSIPWASTAIMIPTIATAVAGRRHAFPHWSRTPRTSPHSE